MGTTKSIVAKEGFMALYHGITGSILRQFVLIGCRLGFYNIFKKMFEDEKGKISFAGKFGCGLLAGAVGMLPYILTIPRIP